MSKIKKIGLFPNCNDQSIAFSQYLGKNLEGLGYIIDKDDFDLAIAVGGDGSFLRMVKDCSFDEDVYYVGVNTGTLGFAQDIYPSDMSSFLQKLSEDDYKIEEVGTLKTEIQTKDDAYEIYSLNEIIIRDPDLKKLQAKVLVNEEFLGRFIGDGLLIATSFGSTAHNLSYNGSIVYNELHTLQVTPMGPIGSDVYRSLRNSVIMSENRKITIMPSDENRTILTTVDGENKMFENINRINASVDKKIKCLKMTNYDYTKKINEKLLK